MNAPRAPYPPQQHVPPAYPYGPQRMPQGMPPQGFRPQGMPPQGFPPYGYPSQQPEEKKKKKRGVGFWLAIILVIVAIVIAVLLGLYMCDGGSNRDRYGELGQLEGKSTEEIQAMLNSQVDEGMFNIAIAQMVEFESGTSEGDWEIENVPGNRYLMQVTVTRDDNGSVVYESGILDPNYHIQRAPLAYDLPAGNYPCTAVFTALDPETEEMVGQAGAKVMVQVKS